MGRTQRIRCWSPARSLRPAGGSDRRQKFVVGEWLGQDGVTEFPRLLADRLWVARDEYDGGTIALDEFVRESCAVDGTGKPEVDDRDAGPKGFGQNDRLLGIRGNANDMVAVMFEYFLHVERHQGLVLDYHDIDWLGLPPVFSLASIIMSPVQIDRWESYMRCGI